MVTPAKNDRCSLDEQQLLQLPGTTSSDVEDARGSLSPLPWTASKNEGMAGEGGNLLQDFLMWWDPECQDPGRRTSCSNAGGVNTNRSDLGTCSKPRIRDAGTSGVVSRALVIGSERHQSSGSRYEKIKDSMQGRGLNAPKGSACARRDAQSVATSSPEPLETYARPVAIIGDTLYFVVEARRGETARANEAHPTRKPGAEAERIGVQETGDQSAARTREAGQKSSDRGSFRKGAARFDASMAIFAEIVSCERVPFRKGQVENALRLLHEDVKPGSRRYNAKRFGGAPQMIVTKARFRYPWSTDSGTFCACRASLSFDDGARSGFVRISYIAALDSEGKSVPGFLLKVQIWIILTEQVRAGTEETLIQTYTTIASVQTSERCPFRWEREVVEQVVIPEWDRGIAGGRRELESMLIDRASS